MRRPSFPRTTLGLLCLSGLAGAGLAATDVRVNFTLNTTDPYGAPLQQQRFYDVYRPDNLPRTSPVPMVLVMLGGSSPLRRKAGEAGFIVVTCSFSGNSTGVPGTVWNSDNPRITGWEDYDYVTEVIKRVRVAENASDAFITGLSKGGHMALAYACERPDMIKAAGPVDEFMGLTSNIPSAPVPIIAFQGTSDNNVPYTMMKDTVDAWRAVDGLSSMTPVTTYEASRRLPGKVSQATWRGGTNGTQVAMVTVIGGGHSYPVPEAETGYDFSEGIWAFFSQFLTPTQDSPKIVAQPVNNIQPAGEPASFRVTAMGNPPLSYQWQKNGVDIPGATADWYTVPPDAAENGAAYRAIVSNDSGSVASAAATLTLTAASAGPAITAQPADQAVTAGQPVTFTVTAAGVAPLRYGWTKNGVTIPGASEASFTIPAAIPSDSGASFSVVVTDATGRTTSNRATLTVTPASGAPILITNPGRARVLPNQIANFSVTAWSASPMTYQWQKGKFTGNMVDIPGATEATYTIPPPTLEDHLTLFRCVVSNAAGAVSSASEMLFVTADVKAPTDITSPITASAQVGVPFEYSIASSGGTAPIRFVASPLPPGLSVDADSGLISGTPTELGTTAVTMTATNSAGSMSRVLMLTVTDTPPPVSIDAWRRAHFGAAATDPSIAGDAADPDGDGYTNLDEFNAGTDPLDAASTPGAPTAPPA